MDVNSCGHLARSRDVGSNSEMLLPRMINMESAQHAGLFFFFFSSSFLLAMAEMWLMNTMRCAAFGH